MFNKILFNLLHYRYQTLKQRRKHEIEGFTSDIQMLRKRIQDLEKHIVATAPVEDKELGLLGIAKGTSQKVSRMANSLHTLKVNILLLIITVTLSFVVHADLNGGIDFYLSSISISIVNVNMICNHVGCISDTSLSCRE